MYPYERGRGSFERHGKEKVMKMKAEVRGMQPPTRSGGSHQELEEEGADSPLHPPEELPYQHLGFGFLAPKTGREHVSYALSHRFLMVCYSTRRNPI